MPIRFECPQGHSLQVRDDFPGKRAKCPTCGTVCVVPAAHEPVLGEGYTVCEDVRRRTLSPAYPAQPANLNQLLR